MDLSNAKEVSIKVIRIPLQLESVIDKAANKTSYANGSGKRSSRQSVIVSPWYANNNEKDPSMVTITNRGLGFSTCGRTHESKQRVVQHLRSIRGRNSSVLTR